MVRLSGDQALTVCGLPASTRPGVIACTLPWDGLRALALVYRAPSSFTGEDTVELLLPGHPVVLERTILACIERGARGAEPGEFTARSWMNGKRTLDEAEGIALAIAATSDAQLAAARRLQGGEAGRSVESARDGLSMLLSLVEAGIDFTDQEDVVAITGAALADRLEPIVAALRRLDGHAVAAALERPLPWVVFAGAPNAGKSSLFNAMLGRVRTVASGEAGTTRDAVGEPISIDGQEVLLVDAPGTAPPTSSLEAAMQEQARQAIARAALVLRCVPPGGEEPERGERDLIVRTKCDLLARADGGAVPPADARGDHAVAGPMLTSATQGIGLEQLKATIGDRLAEPITTEAAEGLALLPRHQSAIRVALRDVEEAQERAQPHRAGLPDAELVAAHLRQALDALGSIAGAVTPDDVIGLVFARFCVGK